MIKISLKYTFSDLFKGKFPNPKKLYECLSDLDERINSKTFAEPVQVYDVALNKTNLKKSFGDGKKFNNIGIVHNKEGSYLVIADKFGHWLYYTLDEV